MCIYGMWPWNVAKWPWFWAEVAVKAWRDLATLVSNGGSQFDSPTRVERIFFYENF
jgi:hypothetical protein